MTDHELLNAREDDVVTELNAMPQEYARRAVGRWLVEQGAKTLNDALQTIMGIMETVVRRG